MKKLDPEKQHQRAWRPAPDMWGLEATSPLLFLMVTRLLISLKFTRSSRGQCMAAETERSISPSVSKSLSPHRSSPPSVPRAGSEAAVGFLSPCGSRVLNSTACSLSPSHVPPRGPLMTGMIVAAPGTRSERDSNLLTWETSCSSAGRGGMHGCTLNTAYQLMVTLRRKIKRGKGAEREKVGEAGGGVGITNHADWLVCKCSEGGVMPAQRRKSQRTRRRDGGRRGALILPAAASYAPRGPRGVTRERRAGLIPDALLLPRPLAAP